MSKLVESLVRSGRMVFIRTPFYAFVQESLNIPSKHITVLCMAMKQLSWILFRLLHPAQEAEKKCLACEKFLVCTCSIQMLLYSNLSQNQNQTNPFTRQALCYVLKCVRQCVVMKCENQPTGLCVRSREYKKSVIQDFSIINEPLQILDKSISVKTILQKLVHIETNFRNLNLSALDTTNQPKNEVSKGQALLWIIKKHWQSIVHTGKCKSKIWPSNVHNRRK